MEEDDTLSSMFSRSMNRPSTDNLDSMRRMGNGRPGGAVPPSGKYLMNRNISATLTVGKKAEVDSHVPVSQAAVSKPAIANQASTRSLRVAKKSASYVEEIDLPIWFHEQRTNPIEVLVSAQAIPGGIKVGEVFSLQPPKSKKKLVFVVNEENLRDAGDDPEAIPTKEGLSFSSHYQSLLDMVPRDVAKLSRVSSISSVEADSVEIFIKDVNMARDSMWAHSSFMVGQCVYVDQRLTYQTHRLGMVKYIYKGGKQVFSGYISANTNVVYRSESAKLTVLVQLSMEMWHFEENGEIMFHKLVNSLFPEVFKRWCAGHTHHSITIVLFTSVDLTTIPWSSFGSGERPKDRRDYFRVVVDQVNILQWDQIMSNLRLEFANFKRDIMLNLTKNKEYVMEGEPLPTVKGNILEAINLGLSLLLDKFRNTDLKHSLNHFIVVTPGSGLFDVEYDLLKSTSEKITSLDCGLDIVCMSPPPLHITPVFRYLHRGHVRYCVPNWCDVSFYRSSEGWAKQWIPRCKIYELQMMGVMETDLNDIRIDRFYPPNAPGTAGLDQAMEAYDEGVFRSVDLTESERASELDYKFGPSTSPYAQTTLALIRPTVTMIPSAEEPTTGTVAVQDATTTAQLTTNDATTALSKLYTLNKNDDNRAVKRRTSASTLRSIKETFRKLGRSTPVDSPRATPRATPAPSVREEPHQGTPPGRGPPATSRGTPIPPSRNTPSRGTPIGESRYQAGSRTLPESYLKPHIARRSSDWAGSTPMIHVEEDVEETMDKLWVDVANPLQHLDRHTFRYLAQSRWTNVFPKKHKRRPIKWRSFMAPAALPTTTPIFLSPSKLDSDYTFQIYSVVLADDNALRLSNSHALMYEMVRLRLVMGFQVCYSDAVKRVEAARALGAPADHGVLKYFTSETTGTSIYLAHELEIHRISCDFAGNLSVQLYTKTPPATDSRPFISLGAPPTRKYTPLIRTRYADDYSPAHMDFLSPTGGAVQRYNWNQLDQFVAGYDDALTDPTQFHQMKFVVMPTEVPKNTYVMSNDKLSDEEVRVEGLRKLVAAIERDKTREPEIMFYTGSLFDFLGSDFAATSDFVTTRSAANLSTSTSLVALAQELQGPNGLQLTDRKWHFKKHLRCFVGSDFVSWLVDNFDDITTREDALAFGSQCMEQGMFKHVEARHGLLDGHYFYKFETDYVDITRPDQPKQTWFKKNSTSSAADTGSNKSSSVNELRPTTTLQESEVSSQRRRRYVLSRAVRFNVDPTKNSDRPELITVHYDRVHNPEHCYHIRLQWLNTTAKFIDETITNWSRLCARHGLKLVETPWKELCQIPRISPFHSFVELRLALNPLSDGNWASDVILKDNPFYYHLYFLKKMEFFLDNRSTTFFNKEETVEITYSWGSPDFKYAQFIHVTGTYMVELRDNGEFFMAPNNIHMIRANSSIISTSIDSDTFYRVPASLDPQKVMLKFRSACQDVDHLRALFDEAKENWHADLSVSV
ncbi:vacuolar membrane-associated protein Iml1p [Diutina catenulata]